MNLRSSVEQRAWLERDAGRGQPVDRQDQHVDSGSSSDRFSGRILGLTIGQKRALVRSVTLSIEFCWRRLPKRIPTASVDCKWAAWREERGGGAQRKGSAAVVVRGVTVEVLGRGSRVHGFPRALFGDRFDACVFMYRYFPIRSWKRCRTMTVRTLRMREPVNNGRRNHQTFSRKQLSDHHSGYSHEKVKLDGAANSTPLVLRKSLSFGSTKKGRSGLQTSSILCLEQLFSRSFRRDHCESGVAELDYCHKCMQWNQVLEPKMQEFLGTVRTECLVLDHKYWRHPDDAVCKRFPTDVGGVQLVCKPCSVEYQPEFRARSGNHLPARHLSVVINVVICLFASIDLTQWCSAMLVLVCF